MSAHHAHEHEVGLPTGVTHAIEAFAQHQRVLVATDFDGVLAPLVLDPMSSHPQPGTLEALHALAEFDGVSVAIVSGRDLATLRRLTGLSDADDVILIGSHGAESSTPLSSASATPMAPGAGLGEAEQAALTAATASLGDVVERFPEARIEHKPAGVVLHTRGMVDNAAQEAASAAMAVPDDVAGVRAMRGKAVVELSVLDVTKGSALAALARQLGTEGTAYTGDDVTDETVFTALADEPGHLTVKVGDGESAAGQRLDDCSLMPAFLDALRDALRATR